MTSPSPSSTPAATTITPADPVTTTTTTTTTITNKDVEMSDLESTKESKLAGENMDGSANEMLMGSSVSKAQEGDDVDTRELRNTEGAIAMAYADTDITSNDNTGDAAALSKQAENTNTTTADAITSNSIATPILSTESSIASEQGPICIITLLLTSGARHPYKLDSKYLAKRNVNVPGTTESGAKDPFSISVYTLKELILREWREEWEGRPSSPSSIRLIHFGRLLDDKMALKGWWNCSFFSLLFYFISYDNLSFFFFFLFEKERRNQRAISA